MVVHRLRKVSIGLSPKQGASGEPRAGRRSQVGLTHFDLANVFDPTHQNIFIWPTRRALVLLLFADISCSPNYLSHLAEDVRPTRMQGPPLPVPEPTQLVPTSMWNLGWACLLSPYLASPGSKQEETRPCCLHPLLSLPA